jgi:hypothetical protein
MKRQRPVAQAPVPPSLHKKKPYFGPKKAAASSKRSRSNSNNGTFQLPNIPGIPIDVLPLHLQCLRACHDFVRRVAISTALVPPSLCSDLHQEEQEVHPTSSTSINSTTNVLDSLFQRMDSTASTSDANTPQRTGDCSTLRQQKDNMVSLWLQSIHRHLRNNISRKGDITTELKAKHVPVDVPTAVARHLMMLLLPPPPSSKAPKTRSTTTVSMQRAATYMMHLLLQKSSVVRNYFCSSSSDRNNADDASPSQLWIVAWMDQLQQPPSNELTPTDALLLHWDMLHQESYQLLRFLHQSFNHCYPMLDVAMQRFQGQCPTTLENQATNMTAGGTTASPKTVDQAECRRLRDTAMERIEFEERKLLNLLQKAYQCIDLLVPRLVADEEGAVILNSDTTKSVNTDDDKDIDWEDGVEVDSNDALSHLLAVEHTMATMKSIGGQILLPEDELAIDFGADLGEPPYKSDTTSNDVPQQLGAEPKSMLRAIVETLQTKNGPRLSAWETGLVQADDLITKITGTAISSGKIASNNPLVRMSSRQVQQRNNAMARVTELKKQVASVISSALRLGVVYKATSKDCV